jgi:hypothetical protein
MVVNLPQLVQSKETIFGLENNFNFPACLMTFFAEKIIEILKDT